MVSTFNKGNIIIYIRGTNICTGSTGIVFIFLFFEFCICYRYKIVWGIRIGEVLEYWLSW